VNGLTETLCQAYYKITTAIDVEKHKTLNSLESNVALLLKWHPKLPNGTQLLYF
jgi:hypothetical protein